MPRREVEDWIEIDEHDEVYHIYSDVEIVNVVRGQEEPEHIEENTYKQQSRSNL